MPPIYATSTYVQSSPGRAQGLRVLAHPQPDARCAAGARSPISRAAPPALRSPPGWRRPRRCSSCSMPARTSSRCTTSTAAATGCSRTCASARPGSGLVRRPVRSGGARGGAAPETRLIWVETPTNPLLKLVDLAAVAALAPRAAASSPCATTPSRRPYMQRPLEHGFDIVMHSTTKYLNGHSDSIGGAAVVRRWRRARRAHRLPAERARRGAGTVRLLPDAARH